MRTHRLALTLGLSLGVLLFASESTPSAVVGPTTQVAKLPTAPDKAPVAAPAKAEAKAAPKGEGKQLAQLTPVSGDLSAADMIALAYEYAWNEDYDAERAWLEAAATKPASTDTARAAVLLAEARGYSGDTSGAQTLLDQVRSRRQDAEVSAFADLVQALVQKEPSWCGHGQRFYSGKEACLALYADAAQKWKGTYLGGWASIRLAATYRSRFAQPEQAITVLEQISKDYAGTPFSEYALEDAAAAVTFSLNRFGEGRQRYEQLLATTGSDFIRQRATLHLGELLMDTNHGDGAYEALAKFISTWPWHADTVGVYALRGSVAAQLNRYDEAVADATRYLSVTAPKLTSYTGRAHFTLGQAAFARGDLTRAEGEFAQVDDEVLAGQARASLGHVRARRGDLGGALSAFLEAATAVKGRPCEPLYLYQAGLTARRIGDQATLDQLVQVMIAEFPYSHFATLLTGRNVAPPLPAF